MQTIKRFIMHAKKTAFIVEHDFIMATYLADRVIVYEGIPSIDCVARSPQTLLSGMNSFLENLSITFRRDPTNYRPRINKMESLKDREQKVRGRDGLPPRGLGGSLRFRSEGRASTAGPAAGSGLGGLVSGCDAVNALDVNDDDSIFFPKHMGHVE